MTFSSVCVRMPVHTKKRLNVEITESVLFCHESYTIYMMTVYTYIFDTCCPQDLTLIDYVETQTLMVWKQSGYLVVTVPSTCYNCPTMGEYNNKVMTFTHTIHAHTCRRERVTSGLQCFQHLITNIY